MPSSLRAAFGAACVLSLLFACAPTREAELLEVSDIGPPQIEPGRVLWVRGTGFPPGHEAHVRLEGTMRRPGLEPSEVTVELVGRAMSAERIEARVSEAAVETLGGRGSFEGQVAVLFAAHGEALGSPSDAVSGRSASRVIDVAQPGVGLSEELARGRRAADVVRALGLTLGEASPDEPGLPILAVTPDSVGAGVGLIPQDRLMRWDGVAARGLSDLVSPPGRAHAGLLVTRPGEAAPFTVQLPLDAQARATSISGRAVLAAQVGLAWALLILLLLAPTAGVVDWVARRAKERARITDGPPPSRVARAARLALAVGLASALPALDRLGLLRVPVEAVLLAAFALRSGATWIATAGQPLRSRARSLAVAAGSIALVAVGWFALAALGGSTDLSGLAVQQSEGLTSWRLLSTPIGPLALAAMVWGAVAAPAALRASARPPALALAFDDAVLLAFAAVSCALVLGGWGPPEASTAHVAAAGALHVALVAGLYVWCVRARGTAPRGARALVGAVALAATIVLLTALRVALEPTPLVEAGLARVLGVALVVLVVLAAARAWAGRVARSPAPLYPFL